MLLSYTFILGFMGWVSTLTTYCLNQAVADIEHGLNSILTGSIETLELEVSFDESAIRTSSISLGFLCLVCTISNNS